jgi:DNA-binding beta-propeller fold protein YncE
MSLRRSMAYALACLCAAPAAMAQSALKATLVAETTAELSRPHDGAFSPDGKRIYVTDMANSRIRVFDAKSLRLLQTFGDGELSNPHDLDFDREGRLLVADTGNGRVAIYDVRGAKPARIGELTGLANPEGVAIGPDGRVYATNTGAGSVSVFRDGRLERTVGEHGSALGQFARPHDVELGPDGKVYVVDSGNHRIQVLDADLRPLAVSDAALGLKEPKYLYFEGERAWLADEYNHRVLLLDRSLRPLGVLGSGKRGRAATEFNQPEAILARAPDVWVIDTYNDRIVRLRIAP